jgi:hypothetical protein
VPNVSPYLRTLFPDRYPASPLPSLASAACDCNGLIDTSSLACLERLAVHPVTALVRRLPALSSTYQTVAQIQAQYQSASTAQKKKDLKLAQKRAGSGANGGGGPHKDRDQDRRKGQQPPVHPPTGNRNDEGKSAMQVGDACGSHDDVHGGAALSTTNAHNSETGETDPADPTTASASTMPLSGRQKRIEKFLIKQALQQQQQQSQQPRSKQLKARRDHREIRSKAMSNKNQSLLDVMEGGGVAASIGVVVDSSAAGSSGGSAVEVKSSSHGNGGAVAATAESPPALEQQVPSESMLVFDSAIASASVSATHFTGVMDDVDTVSGTKRTHDLLVSTATAEQGDAGEGNGAGSAQNSEAAEREEPQTKRPRSESADAAPTTWFQRFCVIS